MSTDTITTPVCGMTLAFMPAASKELAGVPGRVVAIWPRFHCGDYLVTLEYEHPVKFRNELIQHIEAFVSELYRPRAPLLVRSRAARQDAGSSVAQPALQHHHVARR